MGQTHFQVCVDPGPNFFFQESMGPARERMSSIGTTRPNLLDQEIIQEQLATFLMEYEDDEDDKCYDL